MFALPISEEFTANIVFVAVASSLIPAAVLKLLLSVFFQHSVGFLKLFVALMVSSFLIYGAGYALGQQNDPTLRALAQLSPLIATGAVLLAQALLLALVITDESGQRIPLWQWLAVFVIQYVLSLGLAYLLMLARSL